MGSPSGKQCTSEWPRISLEPHTKAVWFLLFPFSILTYSLTENLGEGKHNFSWMSICFIWYKYLAS